MTNPTDDNVTPIRPGMDLVEWEPADVPEIIGTRNDDVMVYASIIDTPVIGAKAEILQWLDECRGGIELRWHKAKVHTVRSPLYAGRASRHSLRGLWVAFKLWFAWVRDVEMIDLILEVALDNSIDGVKKINSHSKARHDRTMRIRRRWGVTVGGLLMAVLLYRYAWNHHLWLALIIGLAVVVGLGLIGAQRHEIVQFVDSATDAMVSAETVIRAFFKAKIAPKEDDPVKVIGVPHKVGLGVLIRAEVPEGVTFDDVLKAKDRLASSLHCPKQCLELDDLPDEAESLLEIFIADKPASKVKVPDWPLLQVDRFDVFRPVPMGWTPRGDLVCLSLMWVHTLLGAAPRRGKTTILRMMCLAFLLDPRARLIIVDFGGGADYTPLKPYCLKFIHGPSAAQIEEFLALLIWLNEEYERRQVALAALPIHLCPEARLTPALAERPEFAPILVAVDEFQVATLAKKIGEQDKMGEEIVRVWSELQKVCPKVGISFVEATQSADDSVPTELRNIALSRVALTVASYQASIAILGNTAHKLGYDASTLGGLPGLGYSWGTDDGDVDGYRGKVRFANCTPAHAAALLERIARLRRPTAVAGGPEVAPTDQSPERAVPQIVTDVLSVWPKGEVVAHLYVLAEALGKTNAEVSGPLRKLGLPPNQNLKIRGLNRSGYDLIDVQKLTKCDPP